MTGNNSKRRCPEGSEETDAGRSLSDLRLTCHLIGYIQMVRIEETGAQHRPRGSNLIRMPHSIRVAYRIKPDFQVLGSTILKKEQISEAAIGLTFVPGNS